MRNKAQSAMEYLMTYGWAILIVIVVVAALYSMGVFSGTGGGVPCSPCFSNFAYVDHNSTHLIITSGAQKVTINTVTDTASGTISGFTNPINPGTKLILTTTSTFTNGDVVTIDYTRESGMAGTDSATLHSK